MNACRYEGPFNVNDPHKPVVFGVEDSELPPLDIDDQKWLGKLVTELETGKPTYTADIEPLQNHRKTNETPAITADEAVAKFNEAMVRRQHEERGPDETVRKFSEALERRLSEERPVIGVKIHMFNHRGNAKHVGTTER